jgi:hypothetical protein
MCGKDDPPSGTSRPTPHTVLAHAAATERTNRQSPNSVPRTASMPSIPSQHHAPKKSIFLKDPSEWDDLPQGSTPALSTASPAVSLNPFDFWITGDSGTPTPSARSEFGAPTSADAEPLLADEARGVQQPIEDSYKSDGSSDDEHHASETDEEQRSYKSEYASDDEHHASETDQEQDPGAVSREETPIEDSYKSEGASDDEHHATHASRDPQPEALGPEEALQVVPNESEVNSDEEFVASEAGRAQQPAVRKPDVASDTERVDSEGNPLPEGVYLVERILEKQWSGKKLWLKIKWKGLKSASWELAEHMRNELGEKDYEELLETAPRKRRKKGPKW